jgi:flavin-dependent dehydrogenase
LATAIAARLKGLDVLVADGAHPPIDKACGEGLMPDSLVALSRLGVAFDRDQSFSFRGIRFLGEGTSVEATFPGERGIGVRRLRLHQLLINRAQDLGVTLAWGTPVTGVSVDAASLGYRRIASRWIIGADGERSTVRRRVGLDRARSESFRFGFRRHVQIPPWTDFMEIHWGPDCQAYVTPVGRQEVCIAAITRDPHLRLDAALSCFPELCRRLEGTSSSTRERGAVTASRSLRRVFRGSTALIGDASGSVDAITGQGLGLAFQQALALADALASGDLAAYQTEHRRLARRPAFMAELMLSLERFSWLRPRVLGALAADPAIFAQLLAMHVGELSTTDFFFRGMLPLGWQLLNV